ncbi:MAG: 30S ribosomal protein S7 [Gammaproteobacteria bacterium]|nr:30S ribosomal protein S7 [Gammaproteobacteria bacterium]MDE0093911.1 30S ribosomal protein S7 [Gammaproteobacteria bacterium]MDE0252407.1 30S ribosomal protein S7 [Gammaproteobacteria bacterium]MDE0402484.1 30S ribosomal protein S7 [Gammaproteobacteria bacterium]MDE0645882.1 30S ribosomal protein S7 [Gammaproteobacteria bacterium]
MSRRRVSTKRVILPDPKFHNPTLAKFINHVMTNGKKAVAERIVYGALDIVESREHKNPVEVFEKALEEVAPITEVKSRRIGGSTLPIPMEVRPSRRSALAMRWLVDSARERGEKTMAARLAGELIDAANGRGGAIRKRTDTHRQAEANRAFAHYRF